MATTAQRGLLTSLYGFDPVQRRAEQQAGLDRFLAAQQTPQARMGAALGTLFGQYLAPESEEQTRVAKVNSIYNQVMADADPTKPTEYLERLGRLAQSFQQAGLPEQAEITIERISRLTPKREIKEVGGVLVEIPPGKGTPTAIFTAPKPPEAPLTIADRTRLNELITQFGDVEGAKKFRAERDEAEVRSKKAGGTVIDLGGAFDRAFAAQDAKGQAEAWAQAGQAYNSAKPLLRQIGEVERIVPNAFTGKFAEGKLGLSKALGAFGIPIGSSAPDSEYINAISSKLVQQIAKAFPGSLAVKELDQLVKSKPNLNQEAGTILKLLGDIRDEITSQTLTYEKLASLPQKDRYNTNANIVQAQFGDKIARLRSIQRKAANKTASREEAQEGLAIQKELGL